MNKANFNDMFKSILIILLFIIIIGLIWITTNPKLIKDMICSKCNLEGFTSNNTINECNKCYITPFNVSSDNSRLENILNRNINQHNFYFIDNINNYLFTIWKHDTRFNENCTTEEEMNRNRPCCLTDDTLDYEVNQSNFYKSNYIDITLDNTRIGTAKLVIDLEHGIANWGYLIGEKDYWRDNIGIQAQVPVIDFAFFIAGVRKVYGSTYSDHIKSRFNLARMGFCKEGVLRSHFRRGDKGSEIVDLVSYGMLLKEWQNVSSKFDNLKYDKII
mgnify:CR=1 FL=1